MRDLQFAQRENSAPVSNGSYEYLTTRLPFSFDGIRPQPGPRVAALDHARAIVCRRDSHSNHLENLEVKPSRSRCAKAAWCGRWH
ncbi:MULTISPECIES: hypothetical protein [unclassified Variovorax]|uniref:hypothetical protein n=1 Tax=unclassified Variovorax TaxID=663243 RepID=UPI003ED0B394